MAEPNMIYKSAALEMLDKAGEPLSNMQITGFFLDGRYTDYFNVQQVLSDLENTDMITSQTMHNNTRYRLTEEGQRTLALFGDKLTEAIQQDIRAYLSEHRIQFKKENALSANYDKALGGGYLVHCTAKEDQREIINLTLHTATREQAETICNNWKVRYEDVYMNIMDTLIQ